MTTFEIGDEVEVLKGLGPSSRTQMKLLTKGVVVGNSEYYLNIDFGEDSNGHQCGGLIKTHTGWNVEREYVRLVNREVKYTPSQIGDRDDDI